MSDCGDDGGDCGGDGGDCGGDGGDYGGDGGDYGGDGGDYGDDGGDCGSCEGNSGGNDEDCGGGTESGCCKDDDRGADCGGHTESGECGDDHGGKESGNEFFQNGFFRGDLNFHDGLNLNDSTHIWLDDNNTCTRNHVYTSSYTPNYYRPSRSRRVVRSGSDDCFCPDSCSAKGIMTMVTIILAMFFIFIFVVRFR